MGGNGTFAAGNIVKYRWETVGKINGVKVLRPADSTASHKLPEEAHKSRMYILLKNDGTFSQMRIYDKNHKLRFEIAYHPEQKLDPSRKPVLHYHVCNGANDRSKAKMATAKMYEKFKQYLKGAVYP